MLRCKIFGDPKEEIEKQKRMRTETQETNSIERSPYFNILSNNQHYIRTDTFSDYIYNPINSQYFQSEPLNLENTYHNKIDYYQKESDILALNIEDQMLNLQKQLNRTLNTLNLKIPPIEYIYNPLEYAFNAYEMYIRKYCCTTKKLLLVGMNPGPFGMCQTGIPFGDPICARNFLKIEETIINRPLIECPRRPILGFLSKTREQSGQRLWSFFENVCQTPENFFKNAFLLNFCPIALMQENGRNVTPGEIKDIKIRKSLEDPCQDWYLKVIKLLQPEYIIAIGNYIHKKTKELFKTNKIENIKILCMPHPSPRAAKNQDWHEKAQKFLTDNNLTQYFSNVSTH